MGKTVSETILMVACYVASLVSSSLPLAAFEFTGNWSKVFDCFGPESLFIEVLSCILKLGFFLFALGPDTLEKVFDTVTSVYVEIMFAGLGIFLYHTVMKHKPVEQNHQAGEQNRINLQAAAVLSFCLAILATFALCSFLKFKMPWWMIKFCYVVQIVLLLLQNLWPVIIRYLEDEFDDDEPMILTFKMVATVLGLFTAVVDSVNFHKEDFHTPKWMLVSLSIITAVLNAAQLLIRAWGPRNAKNFLSAVLSKMDETICHLFKYLVDLVFPPSTPRDSQGV